MSKLRFGLVGCGKVAKRHADLLKSGEIAGATLQAVCDINPCRADSFAANYNVKSYHNSKEMADAGGIDAFSILTPSSLHAGNVIQLASFGKPIVVEKPMALRLDDADRMVKVCDKFGVKLFVVKQNRFNEPIIQLRQAMDQGRFGKLVMGTVRLRWCRRQTYYEEAQWRGTWQHDGGVLANQTSHLIDLLVWMMGDVDSVFAKASRALANIEVEDTAVVTLKFHNGALGIIEATTATRPKDLEGSLSIMGEQGSVVVGGFAANELATWQFSKPVPNDKTVFEQYGRNSEHPYGYAHKRYYEHVVDSIINNKQQLIDGLEGRKSLELIASIYESIETGKEISLGFNQKQCKLGRQANNS